MGLLPRSSTTFSFTSQIRTNGEELRAPIAHSPEVGTLGVEVVMLAGYTFLAVGLAL